MRAVEPQLIVNAAAYTAVDKAEQCVGWGEERTPTETPIFAEMLGFAELAHNLPAGCKPERRNKR